MGENVAFYTSPGAWGTVKNPFGKDVANASLFRALAAHGDFDEVGIVGHEQLTPEAVRTALIGDAPVRSKFWTGNMLSAEWTTRAGALIRGKADLADAAWLRRQWGRDRAASLVGIVHTIAPPAIREYIGKCATSPVQPWDALVCTSPAVQAALTRMFEEWGEYLGSRFGVAAARTPRPHLPLVPLGVDGPRFAALADRPDARARRRGQLGIGEADILVLWVGRLSFFEKAFPQPMMAAVEQAARRTGIRIHFAMAGWFPNGDQGRALYEEAARAHAPSSPVSFLDGNDADLVGELWAASDIFLSLVDNVQETFGLTPLEAMAAGLPVVASDWDGYRYTMRDGEEAFLVPTLGGAPGTGGALTARHVLGIDAYQSYVGLVAQHTAVHIGRAADAIAALARDADLRRRMGQAGRERVRTALDWPVVARQMRDLVAELGELRRAAEPFENTQGRKLDPVKGDPFDDFAGFATTILSPDLVLRRSSGASSKQLEALTRLDDFGPSWRVSRASCAAIVDRIGSTSGLRVEQILAMAQPQHHLAIQLTLVWLCKIGILDWETGPG